MENGAHHERRDAKIVSLFQDARIYLHQCAQRSHVATSRRRPHRSLHHRARRPACFSPCELAGGREVAAVRNKCK